MPPYIMSEEQVAKLTAAMVDVVSRL